MNKKNLLLSLVAAVSAAFLISGCGQRATEEPAQKTTEAVTQKQEETEAVIVIEQEVQTEAPTEAVTEVITEAPTEAPTEPETVFAMNLSPEEEAEHESELQEEKVYYAKDDINVRSTPDTENSDNVISSFDQGERVTVVGETPNWFVIRKEDWNGYVYKDNLSETAVEEKTPEERSQAADQEAAAQAESQAAVSSGAETTVGYAESFTVQVNSDANIRAQASSQANIIGILNEGDIVTALGESDNWFQVDVDGTIGYISKTLIG